MLMVVMSINLFSCNKDSDSDINIEFVYNMHANQFASENKDNVFYFENQSNSIIVENKLSGEKEKAIKNPFASFFEIKRMFCVYKDNLYYVKFDKGTPQGGKIIFNKMSIIEIDESSYKESVVYEKNIQREKDVFLGIRNITNEDAAFYFTITNFFLDDHNIYFVGFKEIRKVNRRTGEVKTIIESDFGIQQLAFNGEYIYYINHLNQVLRYDVASDLLIEIPNMVTSEIFLWNNDLLFINPRDHHRIYGLSTMDHIYKITEDEVMTFSCDKDYIYYANIDDHNYLYRIKHDGSQREKILEVSTYNIYCFQEFNKLHILTQEGTYVVDKNTFKVRVLE